MSEFDFSMGRKVIRSSAIASRGCALGLGLVLEVLAGCGGSQPPIGVPPSLPQTFAIATHTERGGSWMRPEARNENLLYASDNSGNVYVYSYPALKLVGTLSLPQVTFGLCTDNKSDIFVTMNGSISTETSNVYEYAHGGTKPIAILNDPGIGNGCAVDPNTGNLAVTNWFGRLGSYDHGNVAVFQNASGSPSVYYDPDIYWYWWCTYDENGNLYVDGYNEGGAYPFGELAKGSSSFAGITFNAQFDALSLQWDDGDLIVATGNGKKSPEEIYRIQVSGSTGTIVGSTALHSRRNGTANGQYLIDSHRIVGPAHPTNLLGLWHYPRGGSPIAEVQAPNESRERYEWWGVALSRAPH